MKAAAIGATKSIDSVSITRKQRPTGHYQKLLEQVRANSKLGQATLVDYKTTVNLRTMAWWARLKFHQRADKSSPLHSAYWVWVDE